MRTLQERFQFFHEYAGYRVGFCAVTAIALARAEERAEREAYRFAPSEVIGLSVIEKIKAVHCYMYQASEHDAWEKSDARAFCKRLETALIHELPGYDAAPWGY